MKTLWVLFILLLTFPVLAQSDDLLLAVHQDKQDEVYLINVETGEQALLTQLGDGTDFVWADVGWSPDGHYVWVVNRAEDQHQRLRLFDVQNSTESLISDKLYFNGCNASLAWSPSGQSLAYFTNKDSEFSMTLMNFENDTNRSMRVNGTELQHWSPDERYIVVDDMLIDSIHATIILDKGVDNWNSIFSPDSRYLTLRNANNQVSIYDLVTGKSINLELDGGVESWSPDSRYLLIRNNTAQDTSYAYYDTHSKTMQVIDVASSHQVRAWTLDSTGLFIYAYLPDQSGEILLRYDINSGETSTIFETSGWIGNIFQHEDWLVILYNPAFPDVYTPTTFVKFIRGTMVTEAELTIYNFNAATNPSAVSWSPDGHLLSLLASDGMYLFDPETASLKLLPVDAERIHPPFWSPDGHFLVFESFHENNKVHNLQAWNSINDGLKILSDERLTIVGWQRGDVHHSLLFCGEG